MNRDRAMVANDGQLSSSSFNVFAGSLSRAIYGNALRDSAVAPKFLRTFALRNDDNSDNDSLSEREMPEFEPAISS